MPKERTVLILSALILFSAFFLPLLNLPSSFLGLKTGNVQVSGFSLLAHMAGQSQLVDTEPAQRVSELLKDMWDESDSFGDYARMGGMAFVLAGPFLFFLFGLNYLVLGLIGKSYNRGIFLALFYTGIGWLAFWLLRDWDLGLTLGEIDLSQASFFKMVGPGYWMDMAGMLLAALSYFFARDANG